MVYNGALLFDVEPVTRVMGTTWGNNVVILPTSYIVYKAGENMVQTAEKSQKDPPDPRFKAYAKIKRSPRITIRPGGGLSRSAAGALGRYLTAQLAAAATAKALGATIDKANPAAADMLQAHPEINVIFGINNDSSLGALAALRAADSYNADFGVVASVDGSAPIMAELGNPDEINQVFAGFQKYLYQSPALA